MELEWKRSTLKPLLNSVLGENQEDLHWKKECQQPQTLLSPVLGETLEDDHDHDDHEEQEWKRAAQQSAAGERQHTK